MGEGEEDDDVTRSKAAVLNPGVMFHLLKRMINVGHFVVNIFYSTFFSVRLLGFAE